MSFKNFNNLNRALASVKDTSNRVAVDQLTPAIDEIKSIASQLANKFARSYSQVQWMKYTSNGDPSDVTPADQNTVPDGEIAIAKQRVEDLMVQISSAPANPASSAIVNPINASIDVGYNINLMLYPTWDVVVGAGDCVLPFFISRFNSGASGPSYSAHWSSPSWNAIFRIREVGDVDVIYSMGIMNGEMVHSFTIRESNNTDRLRGIFFFSVTGSKRVVWVAPTTMDFYFPVNDFTNTQTIKGTLSNTTVTGLNPWELLTAFLDEVTWDGLPTITASDINNVSNNNSFVLGGGTSPSPVTISVPAVSADTLTSGFGDLVSAIRSL